jgi:hypothetical protein
LDGFNFIRDIFLERTALKQLTFFLGVEDWEVIEFLREIVDDPCEA